MQLLDQIFGLRAQKTSVRVELRAGVVTFLTLSYILFVNPQVLSQAGLPRSDVVFATAVASAVATLFMGLWANYPFALAPGMGLNAYFTFGVVGGMGVDWRVALAAVFAVASGEGRRQSVRAGGGSSPGDVEGVELDLRG